MTNTIRNVYDSLLPTLMMSIHDEYVKSILSGQKVIEYRRKFFNGPFQAFVYTTGSGIELFMKCDSPIIESAHTSAMIGEKVQHDNYLDIFDYFKDKDIGYNIPIIEAYQINKLDLQYLRTELPGFTVPQKYFFLDRNDKQNLLDSLLNQEYANRIINNWDLYFKQVKECIDKLK